MVFFMKKKKIQKNYEITAEEKENEKNKVAPGYMGWEIKEDEENDIVIETNDLAKDQTNEGVKT